MKKTYLIPIEIEVDCRDPEAVLDEFDYALTEFIKRYGNNFNDAGVDITIKWSYNSRIPSKDIGRKNDEQA